jgi:hypothetical protein
MELTAAALWVALIGRQFVDLLSKDRLAALDLIDRL